MNWNDYFGILSQIKTFSESFLHASPDCFPACFWSQIFLFIGFWMNKMKTIFLCTLISIREENIMQNDPKLKSFFFLGKLIYGRRKSA